MLLAIVSRAPARASAISLEHARDGMAIDPTNVKKVYLNEVLPATTDTTNSKQNSQKVEITSGWPVKNIFNLVGGGDRSAIIGKHDRN